MCAKDTELSNLIDQLQTCTEDTVILRRLINYASRCKQSWNDEDLEGWQTVLGHIIQIFTRNAGIRRERALLASHAFYALLSMQHTLVPLKDTISNFLQSNSNDLQFLGKRYDAVEPTLFKLICAHGYLQVNHKEIYSDDVCLLIFDVIYQHCIKYTKYSHFAYKILDMWLRRTMDTSFWDRCNSITEEKLEAIIFSNWCNAINEISKRNSISIFNMYLKIMEDKYNGYLAFAFKHCVDTISWQNEIKYDILAEICEVWDNVRVMTSRDFLLPLCTSLTKYNLRSAGTKVYIAVAKKLNEDEWKQSFGCIINYLFHHWGTTENENHNALRLLCKHWLEPLIKKHRSILPYLWDFTNDMNEHFIHSHLQRMASEMRIDLPQQPKVEYYINHNMDIVRLNGFAINCHRVNNLYDKNRDQFFTIRSFLWHNANSTSVHMRDGIAKYFKVFYANVLKICNTKPDCVDDVYYITHWLHGFLLDCFEIGSCYQRKILALNLYHVMLSFTNASAFNKSNNIENISCTLLLEKHLKATEHWEFTNNTSLFALLRLVLDSALDVKQLATSLILRYFNKDILTNSEKQVMYRMALRNCNSSKFYEIESGAALVLILANWGVPLDVSQTTPAISDKNRYKNYEYSRYSDFLLDEAAGQLTQMKADILKAIVQNKPFYGALTALLKITFRSGPENSCLTSEFIEKILCLVKDATDFFLAILSSKSENREYSSSFAEMGLAIDEAIKNSEVESNNLDELNLTAAHQVLVSCIWMSLKVCCEIACEIGTLMYSDETVKCSTNIIVTVLLKCRHKGVVEAAGTAIGHLTRCLCKEAKYCDLPKLHASRILENDDMHSLNITRRGAGLSIMFHRIVVSDNRSDRPLLNFAVQKLLDLLDTSDAPQGSVESQHDSPWTRRLHFLRALVADKEIHAQLLPYMERISLTCFKYLESEIWSIRNASLQLFGAIVPRLVGQSYGEALDFGNGYPINNFVTHYPVLADYIMKELQSFSSTFISFSNALYLHSNIVHILILVSKFSCGGCNLIDYSSQEFVSKAKDSLRILFKNPVLYVRRLAAKAYAAMTDFLSIESEIARLRCDVSSCRDTNFIHGYLLTIKYLKEKLSVEASNINSCSDVADYANRGSEQCVELLRLRKILQIWRDAPKEKNNPKVCYMLEALSLQLSESISNQVCAADVFPFDQNTSVFSSEKIQPGFFEFIQLATRLHADCVRRTNSITNSQVLHRILDSCCIDQSTSFLNHVELCVPVLEIVLERLLVTERNGNDLLLNTMVNYALRTLKHVPLSDTSGLWIIGQVLESLSLRAEESLAHSSLWRFKSVLILMFSKNQTLVSEMLSRVLSLCIHEDEHMRQMAVESVQFSVLHFARLTSRNKLTILHCCLILLKDEILEIREAIAASVRAHVLHTICTEYSHVKHDEYIYQALLSEVMLDRSEFFRDKHTSLSFVKLFADSIKSLNVNATIENPFYHDDNPSYREESKFLNLCFYYAQRNKYNSDKRSIETTSAEYNNENVIDTLGKLQTKYQLQERCSFDRTNLEVVLNTRYLDYLLRKQRIVIQEYS